MRINRVLALWCVIGMGLPVCAYATVGISPSAAQSSLMQGQYEDRSVTFMRDDADTDTEMYVSVFSDDGFLVTEGVGYHLSPGDRELTIPYRIDTRTYEPGHYTGILYIRPERIEQTASANGVRIMVQGGVRVDVTIGEGAPAVPWYTRSLDNMREHLTIYRGVAQSVLEEGSALVQGVFEY